MKFERGNITENISYHTNTNWKKQNLKQLGYNALTLKIVEN